MVVVVVVVVVMVVVMVVMVVMVGCEGEVEDQEIIYLFTGNKKLLCQNNRLDVTQLSPEFWVTQKPLNCSRKSEPNINFTSSVEQRGAIN